MTEEKLQYQKRWRVSHPGYQNKWLDRNPQAREKRLLYSREYQRKRRLENPEKVAEARRKWTALNPYVGERAEKRRQYHRDAYAARREFINRFKMKPCLDCGKQYNPWVMDFDHRPGEKKVEKLSALYFLRNNQETIKEEIGKCDLVCSNCHRERTHRRQFGESKIKIGGN